MNLLKIRYFPTLISSLFFSKLGDYAYEVIFVFIVLEVTNNDYLYAGVVYFFRFIPFIFFGPIGGWLADNGYIKKSLIYSEIIRLIISIIIYISYINEAINISLLISSSFLTTV
ncbi:MFS transporter, partial [Glaesserella parasuis]|nr:MFS transporter [Glaesserella parasuis]